MIEKVLRTGNLREAAVLLERDIKARAEITSLETERIRHVILGILEYVKITNHNRDASSMRGACSGTKRLIVSLTRSRKRIVESSVAFFEEFEAIRPCNSGCRTAEVQVDFTEVHNILGTEAQRAILKRYITPRERSGKKGSIPRCCSAF